MLKILFHGREYVLVGDERDGAIATADEFQDGACSYAHLHSDGKIRRFGEVIGTRGDLQVLGPCTLELSATGLMNLVDDFLGVVGKSQR